MVQVKDPAAKFTFSVSTCPLFRLRFFATDSSAVKWFWDFGDGMTDTVKEPVHYYPGAGYYNVQLKTWDKDGCLSEGYYLNAVRLFQCSGNDSLPNNKIPGSGGGGAFHDSLPTLNGCAPFQVNFQLPKDSFLLHTWYFGDGSSSTLKNPWHTYSREGKYSVSLVVQKPDLSYDTIINRNFIGVGNPKARYAASITNFCDSSRVKFLNQSVNATCFKWNLCSKGVSTLSQPEVTFLQQTNHFIQLTAQDFMGCNSQAGKNLFLRGSNPYFEFKDQLCYGESSLLRSNISGYDSLVWQVGNFRKSGDSVLFTAGDTGSFEVRLYAYDNNECVSQFIAQKKMKVYRPVADFSIKSPLESCDRLELKVVNQSSGAEDFSWVVGPDTFNTKDLQLVLKEAGEYPLSLIAAKKGCSSFKTLAQPIQVHQAKAEFNFQQNSNCFPIQVNFTDKSKGAVSWHWDFGNGDTSLLASPVYTFLSKPQGKVRLSIVDSNQCKASVQRELPQSHLVKVIANQWKGCIPLTVDFSDSLNLSDSILWDFGDGTTAFGKQVKHTYTDIGRYDLTVISKSKEGCRDTLLWKDTISAGKINADFSVEAEGKGCKPYLVNFINQSDRAKTSLWKFGDGEGSEKFSPMKVYSKTGDFYPRLIVEDSLGCEDSATVSNAIQVRGPLAEFNLSETENCGPVEVLHADFSKNAIKRIWYYGDGLTSNQVQVSYTYSEMGNHYIDLRVEDENGCTDHLRKTVKVLLNPSAGFVQDTSQYCVPGQVGLTFTGKDTAGATITWYGNNQEFARGPSAVFDKKSQGLYDISVKVKNANGCSDIKSRKAAIKVMAEEEKSQIKWIGVSRGLTGEWQLLWKADPVFSFSHYQVYREEDGKYVPYKKVFQQQVQQLTLPYRADWESEQCFKVEVVTYCRAEEGPASLMSACSFHLNAEAETEGINLSWERNHYKSAQLVIYRAYNQFFPAPWLSVDSSRRSLVDSSLLCPDTYAYRLGVKSGGHTLYSNIAKVRPINRTVDQIKMNIQRASVEVGQVILEWKPLEHTSDAVQSYLLYRNKLRSGKEIISEIPLSQYYYIDQTAYTDEISHTYSLVLQHHCDAQLQMSEQASTIHLKVGGEEQFRQLKWTPAKGLEGGVKQYHVQFLDESGEWVTYKSVSSEELQLLLDMDDIEVVR